MNFEECIAQLEHNARTIQQLLAGISAERARWQSDPDTWSVLGVMDHLYREERGDFRARLATGLGLPDPSEPQTDVPYASADLAGMTQAFIDEREQSLTWLRALSAPDWDARCDIYGGQISAGDIIVSWVAHDVLHMRQLVELLYAYTTHRAQPYKVDYAGEW
jgi:uncharacterized damage-inducible protein DinB